MKTTAWGWLVLLVMPGCLLLQPLDEVKSDSTGNAGNPSSAGSSGNSSQAGNGSAGRNNGGGPGNGGAPNGVDFSPFTGTWTVTGGHITTTCGSEMDTTVVDPGGTDTFGLGTISDLIFNPGTACEVLADVSDRTASLNSATPDCSYSDAQFTYDLAFDSFEFELSGDGKTAEATMVAYIWVSDEDGNSSECLSENTWSYKR
ncbi:MAG TPA: hypothetical protein VJV79_12110 [Polyangiaceae bacterium]|nr:hypothetical protein [Polyangiaceae bacterium]